ncbi:MAG: SPOR domain-containing protein [Candidatus Zixiibacteriota bacterium]|nr:MAG: SPOR domain-containing protein [candidate division Zixibacteria bacterium]
MKIPGSICDVIAAFLIMSIVAGCARKQPAAEPEAGRPAVSEVDHRGFDPLELPEDREVIPLKHPRSGDIIGQASFVQTGGAGTDTAYVDQRQVSEELDSLNNQAFRIQLFTSKAYGEARLAHQVAEEVFDQLVVTDYEVPYFKVRVGSFASREDAEEYLMRARSAGYSDAWVVMVNVRVKETAPLYDEMDFLLQDDSLLLEMEGIQEDDESED